MRHKVLLTLALCMTLGAICVQPASCGWEWQVTRLTNTPYFEASPRIWGNTVYYSDYRSGTGDIYAWDAVNGFRSILEMPGNQAVMSVYEDKLVVANYANSQYDLYLWDSTNGIRPISTAPGNQKNADIWGDLVVWEGYRSGVSQVYVWDPVNGERPISPTTTAQGNPRVYGNRVVWSDTRHGRGDVYMWSAEEGLQRLSTYIYPMGSPDIYGDRVVMTVRWQETMWDPYGIWEWQAGRGLIGPVLPYYEGSGTRMWGDLLAWGTGVGINAYHPSIGMSRVSSVRVMSHDVYGKSVVWADENYDMWMAELVPEPSSLMALAGFVALLARSRPKRS